MLEAVDLSRSFARSIRRTGTFGAMLDLVARRSEMVEAVRDLNLVIKSGEVVGFIGPNGAGKSTSIKLFTGVLVPTSGKVLIDGLSAHDHRRQLARNYGVVFGHRTRLWWDLPVMDSYKLLQDIYDIPRAAFEQQLEFLNAALSLSEFMGTPVRQLSLGQRVRADLAGALLHRPRLLFLDEPTIGLDVIVKHRVRDLIKNLRQQGETTILLTTHDVGDLEQLCSRIVVIGGGTIVHDGTMAELRSMYAPHQTLCITTSAPDGLADGLKELFGFASKVRPGELEVSFDPAANNLAEIIAAASRFAPIAGCTVRTPSAEDIVRMAYLAKAS